MRFQIRVIDDDGAEYRIEGITRDDWDGLIDPCPECGQQEFNHFKASGGHYGTYQDTVIERADFWDGTQPLFTRCRSCKETLYKHPAFELLYPVDGDDDAVIRLER